MLIILLEYLGVYSSLLSLHSFACASVISCNKIDDNFLANYLVIYIKKE
jgi:hypothetical protein